MVPTARIAACGGVVAAAASATRDLPRLGTGGGAAPRAAAPRRELILQADGLVHADLARGVEMRHLALRFAHALGGGATDARELDALARPRGTLGRRRRPPRRRLAAREHRLDVLLDDPTT